MIYSLAFLSTCLAPTLGARQLFNRFGAHLTHLASSAPKQSRRRLGDGHHSQRRRLHYLDAEGNAITVPGGADGAEQVPLIYRGAFYKHEGNCVGWNYLGADQNLVPLPLSRIENDAAGPQHDAAAAQRAAQEAAQTAQDAARDAESAETAARDAETAGDDGGAAAVEAEEAAAWRERAAAQAGEAADQANAAAARAEEAARPLKVHKALRNVEGTGPFYHVDEGHKDLPKPGLRHSKHNIDGRRVLIFQTVEPKVEEEVDPNYDDATLRAPEKIYGKVTVPAPAPAEGAHEDEKDAEAAPAEGAPKAKKEAPEPVLVPLPTDLTRYANDVMVPAFKRDLADLQKHVIETKVPAPNFVARDAELNKGIKEIWAGTRGRQDTTPQKVRRSKNRKDWYEKMAGGIVTASGMGIGELREVIMAYHPRLTTAVFEEDKARALSIMHGIVHEQQVILQSIQSKFTDGESKCATANGNAVFARWAAKFTGSVAQHADRQVRDSFRELRPPQKEELSPDAQERREGLLKNITAGYKTAVEAARKEADYDVWKNFWEPSTHPDQRLLLSTGKCDPEELRDDDDEDRR